MTKQEKQLLLQDLCARLPYGVVVEYTAGDGFTTIDCYIDCISIKSQSVGIMDNPDKPFVWRDIRSIKPYLRPMSSMTEEENVHCDYLVYYMEDWLSYYEYLNSRHLDHRGLIEKGLALKATQNMYNC